MCGGQAATRDKAAAAAAAAAANGGGGGGGGRRLDELTTLLATDERLNGVVCSAVASAGYLAASGAHHLFAGLCALPSTQHPLLLSGGSGGVDDDTGRSLQAATDAPPAAPAEAAPPAPAEPTAAAAPSAPAPAAPAEAANDALPKLVFVSPMIGEKSLLEYIMVRRVPP